jgi:hypothetical protein
LLYVSQSHFWLRKYTSLRSGDDGAGKKVCQWMCKMGGWQEGKKLIKIIERRVSNLMTERIMISFSSGCLSE